MSIQTVIIIGVSGSGKTTLGRELARARDWSFVDGDDLHSGQNVAKMRLGSPLTDADRWPWLRSIDTWIARQEAGGHSSVVACSALKRSYRHYLADRPSVTFVELVVSKESLEQRLAQRTGHYMPPALLSSQLHVFEPLDEDERGMRLHVRGDRSLTRFPGHHDHDPVDWTA